MWKERTEKKKFEEGFAEESKEIYALTQDDAGSCRMKGESCWTASMRLLAHIDGKTAELKQEQKVLQWMLSEKENKKTGKSVSFEKGNDLSFKGAGIPAEKNDMVKSGDSCRCLSAAGGCTGAKCKTAAAAGAAEGISEACLFISVRYLSTAAEPFLVHVSGGGGLECAKGRDFTGYR